MSGKRTTDNALEIAKAQVRDDCGPIFSSSGLDPRLISSDQRLLAERPANSASHKT